MRVRVECVGGGGDDGVGGRRLRVPRGRVRLFCRMGGGGEACLLFGSGLCGSVGGEEGC